MFLESPNLGLIFRQRPIFYEIPIVIKKYQADNICSSNKWPTNTDFFQAIYLKLIQKQIFKTEYQWQNDSKLVINTDNLFEYRLSNFN